MAALALPLLLGGLPSIISGITGLFKGRGGRMMAHRRKTRTHGGALSVMGKWPLIARNARYRQGGSGAVMGKWPLIARNARYRQGGSMIARTIEQALPLIALRGRPAMVPGMRMRMPPGFSRVGGRARRGRKGGFNFGDILKGVTTGANLIGQLGSAFGFGGGKRRHARRAGRGPGFLRFPPNPAAENQYGILSGIPGMVNLHTGKHVLPDLFTPGENGQGRLDYADKTIEWGQNAGAGRRRRGGAINLNNILKGVSVGARAIGDIGKAFGYGGAARRHRARGGMNLAAFPNVSPAVVKALTMGARALLPSGQGGRTRMPAKMVAHPMVAPHKVKAHLRVTPSGVQKVHSHLKGMGGLLNPAGAGRRAAVLRTARAR